MVEAYTIVGGVFGRLQDAHKAVRELRAIGFEDDKIGLLTPLADDGRDHDAQGRGVESDTDSRTAPASQPVAYAASGLAVIAGLLPPVGRVLAGGTLVTLWGGAGSSSPLGNATGGLAGLGMSRDDAEYFARELAAGKTLVTATATDDADEAIDIFQRTGGKLRL